MVSKGMIVSWTPRSLDREAMTKSTCRHFMNWSKGGAVAQSVECATPGEEVPGSIPAVAARTLLVGSVSV